MKCLTPNEVSSWLAEKRQIEDPHHAHLDDIKHLLHSQFEAPTKYSVVEAFVRHFLNELVIEGDVLIQFVDSYPIHDHKRHVIESIRKMAGEDRHIEEAPGFLFCGEDRELANTLFSLMTCFQWQCNLYGDHDQLTMFNWEGEIFDVWTSSELKMKELKAIVQVFDFKPVAYASETNGTAP